MRGVLSVRSLMVFGLLFLLSAGSIRGEDWPAYRHDNSRSGVTREKLPEKLELEWVFEPAGPPARGWPDPAPWNARKASIPTLNKMAYDDAKRSCHAEDLRNRSRRFFAKESTLIDYQIKKIRSVRQGLEIRPVDGNPAAVKTGRGE